MQRIIIDVREPYEFAEGHVASAINLPPAALVAGAKLLAQTPKDTELILYYRSGARSNASAHYLRELGFLNIVNGINQANVEKKYT